ncbi:MAG: putative DNA binding domain-containing protein [Treponema sp.]|nr:putative DNA binding domain-containing protein [Treponema sp.]
MKISELYSDVLNENSKYEFKAKLNQDNPIKWAKTIVAYANGEGGFIFVGVGDNRDVFGLDLDEIDKTKNLVALINDRHIFPHVKISYQMRSADDNAEKFVLAIKIHSSESVVRYREGDFNETVFVKGDANSTPATPEDIIALSKRKFGVDNETTDVIYSEEAWSDYIDLCKEFRSDKSTPTVKELQNEEILSKDGYAKSGLMMFKDDYSGDDSLICCRLWRGKDKTGTVLDSEKIKGALSKGLRLALQFIERNTKTGWKKTADGGREEIRSYPKEAVREAMVNAIAHRDYSIYGTQIDVDIYSDRIDIVSPGSWLLPKDYNDYPQGAIPSIRRNTIIAACLDVANLMERGGTGFQTMIESYKDSPSDKQPCVMIYPGFLDLRLFDRLYQQEESFTELTDSEKIIELLKESPKSAKELQAVTSYKSRSQFLVEVINPLIDTGKIYREGSPKSPAAVFKLNQV